MTRCTLIAALAAALSWASASRAQTSPHMTLGYESTTGCLGNTIPCWIPYGPTLPTTAGTPTTPGLVSIVPPALRGQGVFTASTSSAAVNSGLSLAPNSGAFPTGTLGGTIEIKVQFTSTMGVYVCWQGGTCTAAVGEYIAPGESDTKFLPTQNMTSHPPTVIATGASAVVVEW